MALEIVATNTSVTWCIFNSEWVSRISNFLTAIGSFLQLAQMRQSQLRNSILIELDRDQKHSVWHLYNKLSGRGSVCHHTNPKRMPLNVVIIYEPVREQSCRLNRSRRAVFEHARKWHLLGCVYFKLFLPVLDWEWMKISNSVAVSDQFFRHCRHVANNPH